MEWWCGESLKATIFSKTYEINNQKLAIFRKIPKIGKFSFSEANLSELFGEPNEILKKLRKDLQVNFALWAENQRDLKIMITFFDFKRKRKGKFIFYSFL